MARAALFWCTRYHEENELISDEALVESLEAAVILVDRELRIQRVNVASESLFAQSRRNLLGTNLKDLVPSAEVERFITECIENSSQFTLRELTINLPNREVLVDMTMSAVSNKNTDGPLVLIELNVINRISRFVREQNQLERQQSFRLMMRGLAHEIKNPLGGIRGAAQLLERELSDIGHKQLTDILIKEADRLTRLVDRVMGSRDQLRLENVNVHEILEHIVDLVSVKSELPIKIVRNYDPTLPEINVDKEQLLQAVLNIVMNAVEAQSELLQVEIGLTTRFVRSVNINQRLQKRVLKVQIWDNGPGVPREIKDNLFDPLITGRPEGTGLGLSITQEILQRHAGVVQLEDYEGKTCFAVYIPYQSQNHKT